VLQTVFRENWSQLLEAFTRIEKSAEPPLEQLGRSPRCFSARGATSPTSFASWCARSREPATQEQVDEIRGVFLVIKG
jgi:hypothetical protein